MLSILGFFRRKENWPILIIPAILMLWAQFGALTLGVASYESVTLFDSPYRGDLPAGPEGEPVADRVVLIVVDGLRVDVSREITALNQLRAQGADRVVEAGQPSLSLPGWTVIGTGAWQEQSGITSNDTPDSIEIDTIFRAAQRAGLTTALVGTSSWKQLYPNQVDTLRILSGSEEHNDVELAMKFDEHLAGAALEVLETEPDFALVYLPGLDIAGHEAGGASEAYRQVAEGAIEQVIKIVEAVDLDKTTVLVTSDHGHIDTGGHAGWEPVVLRVPLIAVGKGILPGEYPDAYQADIAPTAAVLLGIAIPSHNQGDPLFDQIDAPNSLKAARAVDHAEQIAARIQTMMEAIGDTRGVDRDFLNDAREALENGDYDKAMRLAQHSNDNARAQWESARAGRLTRERVVRVLIAAALLIPLALYGWWWAHAGWKWQAPLIGGAIYFLLWNLNYFLVQKLSYSSSWFNTDADIELFITDRVTESMILVALTVIVVAVMRRKAGPGEVARDVVNTLFVIGAVLMIQILIFYVTWNVVFSWVMPDLRFGFKYYLDVFQTTAFWPMLVAPVAALLPLVAMLVAWVAGLIGRRAMPE